MGLSRYILTVLRPNNFDQRSSYGNDRIVNDVLILSVLKPCCPYFFSFEGFSQNRPYKHSIPYKQGVAEHFDTNHVTL